MSIGGYPQTLQRLDSIPQPYSFQLDVRIPMEVSNDH